MNPSQGLLLLESVVWNRIFSLAMVAGSLFPASHVYRDVVPAGLHAPITVDQVKAHRAVAAGYGCVFYDALMDCNLNTAVTIFAAQE